MIYSTVSKTRAGPEKCHRHGYQEDPVHFWVCKNWWRHNKPFFLHQHRAQCLYTYAKKKERNKKHSVPVGQTCSTRQILCKDDGFPDSAETLSRRNFRYVLLLSSGEAFSAMPPEYVRLLFGLFTIMIHRLQVVKRISVQKNDVWKHWPLWPTCDLLPSKWPRSSV